ncbi:embigin [Lates calcarifer]|uniref:Embigin n=1 Tax=Lates calcarifer TaxID=8187 RepID=A0A4W6EGV1_LATCA|nr:embigin [Lates calcarifer]
MSASWKQIFFQMLLLLISCRHINTKTSVPTPAPLPPLPTEVRSGIHNGENQTQKVQLTKPVNLVLECTWTGNQNKLPNVTGHWRKDGVEIEDSLLTVLLENGKYNLKREFRIVSKEDLRNYSCVFGNEAKIDFILAGPQMGEVRDKPIVSYVGDSVVILCKLNETEPRPMFWNWYRANGTDKELIVDADSHRYKIKVEKKEKEEKAKLVVHNLTQADSGLYYCEADYGINTTMGHVELRVITLWEPLKPFIAIVVEVIILVAAILLYEKSQSRSKNSTAGDGTNADQTNTLTQGENNGPEESSSMRQRKV